MNENVQTNKQNYQSDQYQLAADKLMISHGFLK